MHWTVKQNCKFNYNDISLHSPDQAARGTTGTEGCTVLLPPPFSTSNLFPQRTFFFPSCPRVPHKSRLRDVVAASCGRPVREEGFSLSGRARSWLEWDHVWDGTVLGTWEGGYGGQQLAPDDQKLAGPAAAEGDPLFFLPSSSFFDTVSFISTLSNQSHHTRAYPRLFEYWISVLPPFSCYDLHN